MSQFWLVRLVGQKMVVAISNSFYVVLGSKLAPIPNFNKIGQKTQKLKLFAIYSYFQLFIQLFLATCYWQNHHNSPFFKSGGIWNLLAKFQPNRLRNGDFFLQLDPKTGYLRQAARAGAAKTGTWSREPEFLKITTAPSACHEHLRLTGEFWKH